MVHEINMVWSSLSAAGTAVLITRSMFRGEPVRHRLCGICLHERGVCFLLNDRELPSQSPSLWGNRRVLKPQSFIFCDGFFSCCFSKYRLVFPCLRVNEVRYRFLIFPCSCWKLHFKCRRKEAAGWMHTFCVVPSLLKFLCVQGSWLLSGA